jgi:hypothetical protein
MADKKQFSNTKSIVKVETGILFSEHPGISVNELSPLSLRRWNIRHFTFDFRRLKMADSWFLEEVTSPRKREL